ncbi:MAG: MATE family efflux transporter [Clostridia bacterium]|nr:MATE family efflux transporter [Clostridia bacterium]
MQNKFGRDLTVGSVPKHLLKFSIPMLLGNLIQIGHSFINAIWVGQILGSDAVGATGASFPIIFILIGLASGVTMATTILVSQYFGAKDFKMVEKVVNNSFAISLILGSTLTIAGIFSSDFLLRLMDTPPEIFGIASSYLKISIAGFILMYMGFLIMSILRGIGDTMTPLLFMAIGIGINAVLDPLLIIGLGPIPSLGLNGAAYASLIAQIIATAIGIIYLNKKDYLISFNPRNLRLDKNIVFLLLKIGLPSTVQQSLVSIGSAFITTFVNSFGHAATAAFSAVGRVDSVAFMPAMSLSMAVAALTGQNLGAGKPERVKEIFKWGVVMTSAITLLISLLAVVLPHTILTIFGLGKYKDVMDIGVTYLRIVGASYILFAIMFISNGIINGAGHTITTMLFSLTSLWIIRVPLASILSHTQLGLIGIWIAIDASYAVVVSISLLYYFSGRWRNTVITQRAPNPSGGD